MLCWFQGKATLQRQQGSSLLAGPPPACRPSSENSSAQRCDTARRGSCALVRAQSSKATAELARPVSGKKGFGVGQAEQASYWLYVKPSFRAGCSVQGGAQLSLGAEQFCSVWRFAETQAKRSGWAEWGGNAICHSAEQIQEEESGAAGRLGPLRQQLCPEQRMLVPQGTENRGLEKAFPPRIAPAGCLVEHWPPTGTHGWGASLALAPDSAERSGSGAGHWQSTKRESEPQRKIPNPPFYTSFNGVALAGSFLWGCRPLQYFLSCSVRSHAQGGTDWPQRSPLLLLTTSSSPAGPPLCLWLK